MREINFVSPLNGVVIPLEEVRDEAISQKMLGEGFAILPSDGMVVSPVNGKIVALYPTGHAIGILSEDGYEILIHIGVNTFLLKGEGIRIHVKDGQDVKQQEVLVVFDKQKLESNGVDVTTSILFTNREHVRLLMEHQVVSTTTSHIFEIEEPNGYL